MSRITSNIDDAVAVLERGGILGMPTETVYGLAALVHQQDAVGRIFSVKERPTSHPLIVHLSPDADLTLWGEFNNDALALAKEYWPGPLTLLVPRTALVPDWVTGGRDTVAIRVPAHPIAQQLLRRLRDGVVAPSANRFGRVSPTDATHVAVDLGADVDLILDGGPCTIGVESTIVECVGDSVTILRPGGISLNDIQNVVAAAKSSQLGDSRAPGMLASHYAPQTKIDLVESESEARSHATDLAAQGMSSTIINHTSSVDYALHLYADLREADASGVDRIIAVLPPPEGLGDAVRDRLRKAAA